MQKKIRCIFVIRICLWIVALVSTIWWIYYSVKLHIEGIYDVHAYATELRPVLYTCLAISITAVCAGFALYAISKRMKNKEG